MRCKWRLALTALLLLTVPAQAAPPLPDRLAPVLASLPGPQRAQLHTQAARWTAWSEAERTAFRQRAAAWAALPIAERTRRREAYAAWIRLPAEERARVQVMAERLKQYDPDTRLALRARFDALDGSERRGWLLGPTLGAAYPRLQPLLAQVPAAEHAPLLRTLRAMTPQQCGDLAVLVQRTPPQGRAALRRELLATDAGSRQAWLLARLER